MPINKNDEEQKLSLIFQQPALFFFKVKSPFIIPKWIKEVACECCLFFIVRIIEERRFSKNENRRFYILHYKPFL